MGALSVVPSKSFLYMIFRGIMIGIGVALVLWLVLVVGLVLAGRRSAARELAQFLPNLVFLFKGLAADPRVPRSSKVLLGFAVIWFASPIDLIPEFVPVIGPLDDAIVAALVIRRVLRTSGKEVIAEHWRGEPATLDKLLRAAGLSVAKT